VAKISADGSSLIYSTYFGGSGNDGAGGGIAVDVSGNAYVVGVTNSTDLPTAGAMQPSYAGGYYDNFVLKLDPTGSSLIYSTYLGGSGDELSHDVLGTCTGRTTIATDDSGNAYVEGYTTSSDFPTLNPIQGAIGGGMDAFLTKLSAMGFLIYSTYLGGSSCDAGLGVAVDKARQAYVLGCTTSPDFPLRSPLQGSNAGGYDLFITKVDAAGTGIAYSTYLGGSGNESNDGGVFRGEGAIAVDESGCAHVVGLTASADFPTVDAVQATSGGSNDVFIAKLAPGGSSLLFSSYLGGSRTDNSRGIAVDWVGDVYVSGFTQSSDFPTRNPFQAGYGGGYSDGFVAKLREIPDAEPVHQTILQVPYYGQGETNWCWAACASMLVEYSGVHLKPWEIAGDLGKAPDEGLVDSQVDDLATYMTGAGEASWTSGATWSKVDFRSIAAAAFARNSPVWVSFKIPWRLEAHVVVLYGCTGVNASDEVHFHDPSGLLVGRTIACVRSWDEFHALTYSVTDGYNYIVAQGTLSSDKTHSLSVLVPTAFDTTWRLRFEESGEGLDMYWDGEAPYGAGYRYSPAEGPSACLASSSYGCLVPASGSVRVRPSVYNVAEHEIEAVVLLEGNAVVLEEYLDVFAPGESIVPLSDQAVESFATGGTVHTLRISIRSVDGTLTYDSCEFEFEVFGAGDGHDINRDGVIDVADVRLCLQLATGIRVGSPSEREAADIDGDGDVDMDDVRILAEYVIGIRPALP